MSLVIRAALHPPEAPPGLVSGLCLFFLLLYIGLSFAGGIDHTVSEDNSGIWKRSNQQALVYTLIGGEIAGASAARTGLGKHSGRRSTRPRSAPSRPRR